jgi:hypothetical protein
LGSWKILSGLITAAKNGKIAPIDINSAKEEIIIKAKTK